MNTTPLPMRAGQLTVSGMFQQQVARHPDRIALEFEGRQLSYRALAQRVASVAGALSAQGLQRGDRIAILSENRLEYAELEMVAAQLGLVLACQNWRQSDSELEYCIRLVSPKILFYSARQADAVGRIDHGVAQTVDLDLSYEALANSPASAALAKKASVRSGARRKNGTFIRERKAGSTGL